MRVAPRPWIGVACVAAYLAVIVVVQGTSGIPYTEVSASAHNLWRNGVLSVVLASLVVAGLATWFGWWRPALIEQRRTRRTWLLIGPALYLLIALANLAFTNWSRVGLDFVVAGVALGIAVGFGEEFTNRGLLLVGLRGRLREIWVLVVTCVIFGVMHSLNILLGAPVLGTAQQVVLAGLQGSALYILRRVTGSLVWAMVLHGLWDLSIFINGASGGSNPLGALAFPAAVVSVVFGVLATRDGPSTARRPS